MFGSIKALITKKKKKKTPDAAEVQDFLIKPSAN